MIGRRLEDERRARGGHRVIDVRELVDADADVPAEVVVDEDLVLDVAADFRAAVAERRQRQVEVVAAQVAAVGDHLARAERLHVAQLEVVGLRVERERDWLAVGAHRQQAVGVARQDVREEVELERPARVAHRAVAEAEAGDVERPDAGVDDAVGARVTAFDHHLVLAVGIVIVHAPGELGLRGALVRERGYSVPVPLGMRPVGRENASEV